MISKMFAAWRVSASIMLGADTSRGHLARLRSIETWSSSMVLLGGLLCCRATLPWLWFGVNGLLTLNAAAEAKAHGRKRLLPKVCSCREGKRA